MYPLFLTLMLLSAIHAYGQASQRRAKVFVNVKDVGAVGDGKKDNWRVLQRTVDSVIALGGGEIYFPKGVYAIYDLSLIVWGKNVTLKGESRQESIILKRGRAGYYGDCVEIAGRISGDSYADKEYNRVKPYSGQTMQAQNIRMQNLTLSTKLSEYNPYANNLGIVNAHNVNVENCTFENAPQTNVAIVNEANKARNGVISFRNCDFTNSGRHNVRVITYNEGRNIGNKVTFTKCNFRNVENVDTQFTDIKGRFVHFWYRGAASSGLTSVIIDACNFDDSGEVFANSNISGLTIRNSQLKGGLIIRNQDKYDANPKFSIRNNVIHKASPKLKQLTQARGMLKEKPNVPDIYPPKYQHKIQNSNKYLGN